MSKPMAAIEPMRRLRLVKMRRRGGSSVGQEIGVRAAVAGRLAGHPDDLPRRRSWRRVNPGCAGLRRTAARGRRPGHCRARANGRMLGEMFHHLAPPAGGVVVEVHLVHQVAAAQPGAVVARVLRDRAQVELQGPLAVAREPRAFGHAQPAEGIGRVQTQGLLDTAPPPRRPALPAEPVPQGSAEDTGRAPDCPARRRRVRAPVADGRQVVPDTRDQARGRLAGPLLGGLLQQPAGHGHRLQQDQRVIGNVRRAASLTSLASPARSSASNPAADPARKGRPARAVCDADRDPACCAFCQAVCRWPSAVSRPAAGRTSSSSRTTISQASR